MESPELLWASDTTTTEDIGLMGSSEISIALILDKNKRTDKSLSEINAVSWIRDAFSTWRLTH